MRAALFLLMPLAACAAPQPCIPKIEIQQVKVPVPVACLKASDIPAEPDPTKLTGDARNDADLLGAKVSDLRLWGRSLVAMMGPCTNANK